MLFRNPIQIFTANNSLDFRDVWKQVKDFRQENYWIAGFISYECGYLWEEKLERLFQVTSSEPNQPLFQLGVFPEPQEWEDKFKYTNIPEDNPSFNWDQKFPSYKKAINKIHEYLKAGDCYQINYTFPLEFQWKSDPFQLYQYLISRQKVKYSAYIENGEDSILSISPELFLEYYPGRITTKPMKGTATRSPLTSEDIATQETLQNSEKNRSENLMIVDLLRNDLSKFAEMGTVKTKKLFNLETYETVHQMTSTIECNVNPNTTLWDIMEKMFPCGSVTGAPKIRAMEIIRELESGNRSVYTGSIGYLPPRSSNRISVWNIAIRTLEYKKSTQSVKMGIGSGIVLDSNAMDEFQECKNKAKFLTEPIRMNTEFYLIESLLYTGSYFSLLKYHIERIKNSALYFQIPFSEKSFLETLQSIPNGKSPQRIRIQLMEDGIFLGQSFPLELNPKDISDPSPPNPNSNKSTSHRNITNDNHLLKKITIHPTRINSNSIYLYHKTSFRLFYDDIYKNRGDFYDILFLNERGEITETCVHNIFLLIGGIYFTPGLNSGLLPGTFRSYLLNRYPKIFQETILYPEDLKKAERIVLCNSVRGFQTVACDVRL